MTSTAAALPESRTRRRPRAWFTASVWMLLLLFVVAAATLAFVLHRGDPEGSARIANAEIEASLEGGERVVARVPVQQRLWWDYYRHTYGVLAATDRRLHYVGVPPAPLLHEDDGPPELVSQSFPYTRGLAISKLLILPRRRPGVRLAGASGTERFAIAPWDTLRLVEVLGVVTRAQTALREVAEAERRATEAAAAASRRPIYHLVQRGEALAVIARRYGVPVESLTAWNALSTSRITVGSRLLVRPGREP
ncbi:MAG: LysM peptidoglycan-binding domain-containing protein [Gemmatimonadaceae bacterium]